MASHQIIADLKTVITNGPNAATVVKANAAAGIIMDYLGNVNLSLTKSQEASALLGKVITNTNAADSANLTLLQGIQACLLGTSSPSTQLLTDIKSVYTTGPGAATIANCNAAAGVIMDYLGCVEAIRRKLQETAVLTGKVVTDTDASDATNLGLLQGITAVLV